ncbi:MAG: putative ABC transporter permease [Oscillospiraceae bacterium]|nr:putative ABC transporter permease [Oscillospiraceae bacterium]
MTAQNIKVKGRPFAEYTAVMASHKKIDLYKSFWIFLIGSVVGFTVETIWCLITTGGIQSRSSMVIGPFTAIYGIGALALYLGVCFVNKYSKHNKILYIFIYGTVASTVVEYICSLLQQALFGSVSWDYSNVPLNIRGRACLLYSAFWGLLAILWYIAIQPPLEKFISKIPAQIYKPLTLALATFIIIDSIVSVVALSRWGMRIDGIQSTNIVMTAVDKLFPNEFMAKIYPNMVF